MALICSPRLGAKTRRPTWGTRICLQQTEKPKDFQENSYCLLVLKFKVVKYPEIQVSRDRNATTSVLRECFSHEIFSEATGTWAVLSVKLNWNQVLCFTWNCYFFIFFCSRVFKGIYLPRFKVFEIYFQTTETLQTMQLPNHWDFSQPDCTGKYWAFQQRIYAVAPIPASPELAIQHSRPAGSNGTTSLSSALCPSITHRSPHGLQAGPCCDTALGTDEQIFCKCSADLHCSLLYLVDALYVTSSILSVPGGDQTFTLRSAGRRKAACNQGQTQVNWIYPLAIWATQIFPYLYTLELRLHSLFVSRCATGMKEVFTHSDQNPSLLLIVHFYCICLYWI